MLINGKHHQSIELVGDPGSDNCFSEKVKIKIIDQRFIPFRIDFKILSSSDEVIEAISSMQVRGAPIIGITAAFGVVFACEEAQGDCRYIHKKSLEIIGARPTAVNAKNCVNLIMENIETVTSPEKKKKIALHYARLMLNTDIQTCKKIGQHGVQLIREISSKKGGDTVNILTHCNAGWLACVDYGTATSPIYLAQKEGIKLHVWVDETRPRNQGARLTVWELTENGIDNTLITDNAGGYLMQEGLVDLVLVGSDRTTINGDAANKIGTYLKALAAKDNLIPFYVASPSDTFDWSSKSGFSTIPIERRTNDEIKLVEGLSKGKMQSVLITTEDALCFNPGFDVTPARLITGLITERGICKPSKEGIYSLFPEKKGDI